MSDCWLLLNQIVSPIAGLSKIQGRESVSGVSPVLWSNVIRPDIVSTNVSQLPYLSLRLPGCSH